MTQQDTNDAQGLAAGVIVSALLDVLHKKGVLTLDETREVLKAGMNGLAGFSHLTAGTEAGQLIAKMLSGRFSARSKQPGI